MRILHTADLHYGMSWNGQPRLDDQDRILDELLGLCEQHDVDMLLIAGDVFHDRVARGHVAAARRLLIRLLPALRRGRAVFLLRGNHDPLELFQLMELVLGELADEQHLPFTVATVPNIYRVPGHRLQVIALPYLTPAMLRSLDTGERVTAETEVVQLSGILGQALEQLYQQVSSDDPAIFTAHVSLSGASITPDLEFESGYHRELWLEPARLPQFTSYNALGHIHLHQPVRGTGKPTWYAGGPDRLNLGEREYTPRVLLVDTPDDPGGVATVMPLEIECPTPFIRETLDGSADVDAFCATPGPSDPLGEVTISGIPVAARPMVMDQIRAVAPRLRLFLQDEQVTDVAPVTALDYHDVYGTVATYLERTYSDRPERRELLQEAFAALWEQAEQDVPA